VEFTRILVAVDFRNQRDAVFAHALELARLSGGALYVLHAVPADRPFSFRAAERLQRMADLRRRAEAVAVAVQTVEQHGDPAEIIALHANARSVNLIVMGGSPRRGWLRRPSVAERVIRRTRVLTLVMPREGADVTALRHVLVAVDASPTSRALIAGWAGPSAGETERATAAALRTAFELSRRHGARITLLHAIREAPGHQVFSGGEAGGVVARLRTQREAIAGRLRRTAANFGLGDADVTVTTGDPGRAILDQAAGGAMNLIVAGFAPRSWFDRLLFGSTLGPVLRRATVPVLVVPAAPSAGPHDRSSDDVVCGTTGWLRSAPA